jgi:uncharacterized protein YhfF
MNVSVTRMWAAYRSSLGEPATVPSPPSWHFCDNQADADNCAALVLSGRKRATAPSKWYFDSRNLPLPAVGDLDIVTDWQGIAQCIIRTTAVSIVRFCDVTAGHALAEGEGDGSLEFWRSVHWDYYRRELGGTGYVPTEDMPIVCQYFERIFPYS